MLALLALAIAALIHAWRSASITIEVPAPGEPIAADPLDVRGRFTGPPFTVVDVDAVEATTDGNRFESKGIPVGSKTVVTATLSWRFPRISIASDQLKIVRMPLRITIEEPGKDAVTESERIAVSGTYIGPAGAKIDVNGEAATVSGTRFSASKVPLQPDINILTATARVGGREASDRLRIWRKVDCQIEIAQPAGGWETNAHRFSIRGVLRGSGGGVTLEIGGKTWKAADGEFVIELPLKAGENRVILNADAPQCRRRISLPLAITRNSLRLVIQDPPRLPGNRPYAIVGDRITISGFVETAGNIDLNRVRIEVWNEIVKNGIVESPEKAIVLPRNPVTPGAKRFEFVAMTVPLELRSNRVVAEAAFAGLRARDSRNIERHEIADFRDLRLAANPQTGPAPLSVSFAVAGAEGLTFERARVQFGDRRTGELDPAQLSGFRHDYPAAGTYRVEVVLNSERLGERRLTLDVTALEGSAQDLHDDALAVGAYKNLLSNLRQGKIEEALADVAGGVYEKYKAVFLELQAGNTLKDAAKQAGELQADILRVGENVRELLVIRNVSGTRKAFRIHVLRSEDGSWRVEGM